jgi:GNAT superfamily N-acetyltransferase
MLGDTSDRYSGRSFAVVRLAMADDLDACIEIEEMLREDRAAAATQGFLLSEGDNRESYTDFLGYGSFFVAVVGGEVAGFAFALPPKSSRMEKIRAGQTRFHLHDEKRVFGYDTLAWMAKVGVKPQFMRRGIASALYRAILENHSNWHFLTTTVLEPLRNLASERLHKKFGFKRIGELALGDRGALKSVKCSVWYRSCSPVN